jgi:4-amino-4-deoxy-L-arabinose transferase-like glycosyltransferase
MKVKPVSVGLVLALVAILCIPRLAGISLFTTVDEPYWLTAGSDFYYALGQRAFASTVYDYHPAVTTMWIVAAAMLVYFPQYRGLGQGYFDVYKDSLERFLLANNHTPLGLLTTARVMQACVILALLILAFWLLRRLLGGAAAATATLMISFDPFYLGHSRLLNHEAMLSLLVLVSLLAFLAHLFSVRGLGSVVLSGAAAGFAQLTKSSSVVIIAVVPVLALADATLMRQISWGPRLRRVLATLGVWSLTLLLVYVMFWPGMWVAPGKMLSEVFGNALSYAFEGTRLSVAGVVEPKAFQPNFADVVYYVQSVLWRTTPIVWFGALLGLGALVLADWKRRVVLIVVMTVGGLFILLFGLASGRNSAHYVLTSYVALDVLAGAGLAEAARLLGSRLHDGRGEWLPAAILCAAVLIQAGSGLRFFPYYYTYYSPIMEAMEPGRQNSNAGYGEGLELAAGYLNAKPEAQHGTATVFYGRGCFSYFYAGKTEPLKPVYADAENVPQLLQILHQSDYLVIYYVLEKGRDSPANVLRALSGASPETTIRINDIEYIRIYRVDSLPADFYASLNP